MNNTIVTNTANGDFTVQPMKKERTMKKAPLKQQDFILLSPLQPSIFGYTDDEVSRMISELGFLGIRVMLVDTEREMFFYARASRKELLEDLCTAYDIGGILVEAAAVYDQVSIKEVVGATGAGL